MSRIPAESAICVKVRGNWELEQNESAFPARVWIGMGLSPDIGAVSNFRQQFHRSARKRDPAQAPVGISLADSRPGGGLPGG